MMRILHTSDWHLGKTLEGFSRLEEQKLFLEELLEIIEEQQVDLVMIAGDIYDTANPPAAAEKLFYSTLERITKGGRRGVLVIAGNHDNPERLEAAATLAYPHGVILLGKPSSRVEKGKYGPMDVLESGEGYLRIRINGQESVIATLPCPSEKRLDEILPVDQKDEERRKCYSERIGELFQKISAHFREDTINLAVSHLYMTGGEESQSERPIQLGGTFAVEFAMLPDAQYIALGHLHKSQRVSGSSKVRYSGSPLQYSRSEIHNSNAVYIVDLQPGQEPVIQEVFLRNYKPIEIWECSSIEEAIERCRANSHRDIWVYMDIKTDRGITQGEIKEMKSLVKDIVQIRPIFPNEIMREEPLEDINVPIDDLFSSYYRSRRGTEPPEELMDMFYKILGQEDDSDEAEDVENSRAE
jgi:exonuclease SbcD